MPITVHLHCSCIPQRYTVKSLLENGCLTVPFYPPRLHSNYNSDLCHLQRFLDARAIVGCISEGNERRYRGVVLDFVVWCEKNHQLLNASKFKKLVVGFR